MGISNALDYLSEGGARLTTASVVRETTKAYPCRTLDTYCEQRRYGSPPSTAQTRSPNDR